MPTLSPYAAIMMSGLLALAAVRAQAPQRLPQTPRDSTRSKITRALAAGPPNVAEAATVAEPGRNGTLAILRPGTNGFTCMPGDPTKVGAPALCADAASLQWMSDFAHHKPKPTNTVPGITYMLEGATQRSDTDPYDSTSPPKTIGPHWMIMWAFDPKTSGLRSGIKATGAFIMWAGSPYAHVHVMGVP
jgi:hypothetical protein